MELVELGPEIETVTEAALLQRSIDRRELVLQVPRPFTIAMIASEMPAAIIGNQN